MQRSCIFLIIIFDVAYTLEGYKIVRRNNGILYISGALPIFIDTSDDVDDNIEDLQLAYAVSQPIIRATPLRNFIQMPTDVRTIQKRIAAHRRKLYSGSSKLIGGYELALLTAMAY